MKILIIKFRNIGDILLATPLISNLKSHFPQSNIDFATNLECLPIIERNPNISNLIFFDREKIKNLNIFSRFKEELSLILTIRRKRYDLVLNLTEGERGAIYAISSRAERRMGLKLKNNFYNYFKIFTNYLNDDQSIHAAEKDLRFLNLLDKEIVSYNLEVFWNKVIEKALLKKYNNLFSDKYVIVHPVSRWMFKCWDNAKMARAIDHIKLARGCEVIITASKDDNEIQRVKQIISLTKSNPINLSGLLNIEELTIFLSRASLFFGIDSAPMHIAAACGTPIVSLFGASYPVNWGPWVNHKNKFKNVNGVQFNGKHYVISNMNHEIFYDGGIKKTIGMEQIEYKTVENILDKIL